MGRLIGVGKTDEVRPAQATTWSSSSTSHHAGQLARFVSMMNLILAPSPPGRQLCRQAYWPAELPTWEICARTCSSVPEAILQRWVQPFP